MTGTIAPFGISSRARLRPSARDALARRAVHAVLGGLSEGELTVEDAAGARTFGSVEASAKGSAEGERPLRARIAIHTDAVYRRVAARGTLGAAEAYMEGLWSADDLVAALRILLRDAGAFERLGASLRGPLALWERLRHRLRRNTREGSRRNISAHYDLGNDFYALFLDPTMTYSCGVFERPDDSLERASRAKYERIARKLALGPGDRVLEIGGGWGGFAVHAARTTGCRVTSATISREQAAFARERVAAEGLSDRIDVVLEDYRSLRGTWDKLVSIEMVEAVGYEYLDTYFRVCSARLAPHGAMLLQSITTPDHRLRASVGGVDFIKRYVFPGGQLPSLGAIAASTGRATDLRVEHLEDLSAHYATTLAHWRQRFHARRERVAALGYDETFQRMWDFYLASCEAAFAERYVGVAQILLAKPRARRPAPLGPLPPGATRG